MKMSNEGIAALKLMEGFREQIYTDAAGYATIGYGHRVKLGDGFTVFDRLTEEQGTQLLVQDVEEVELGLFADNLEWLEQCQWDALVCFVFNIGLRAFRRSTMAAKLHTQPVDAQSVADEFGRWVFITVDGHHIESEGLHMRRNWEQAIFLGHGYPVVKEPDNAVADSEHNGSHAEESAAEGAQGAGSGEGDRPDGAGAGEGRVGEPAPEEQAGIVGSGVGGDAGSGESGPAVVGGEAVADGGSVGQG